MRATRCRFLLYGKTKGDLISLYTYNTNVTYVKVNAYHVCVCVCLRARHFGSNSQQGITMSAKYAKFEIVLVNTTQIYTA